MPEISFKGVRIHFTDEGKGPAVVLLHGFLESSWMWSTMAPELGRGRRLIAIDLPGHGLSECIGYVHTMEEMAEAVHAVVKHLQLRKICLIGHSMGGYVALAYTEANPDTLKSLVLYQSTALADSDEKKESRQRALEVIRYRPKSFVRQSIPALFRPVNRKRFHAQVEALKDEAMKTPVQGIVAAISGMRDRPSRELILKFPPCPVHVVAGDKDPRIPFAEAEYLAGISDAVTLHVIKGSGHMSYIEARDETIDLLRRLSA